MNGEMEITRAEQKALHAVERLVDTYKENDTIEKKIFWTIVPLSSLTGIVSVIGTVIEGLGPLAVASGILCVLAPLLFCLICKKTKNCEKCYFAFCLCLNVLLIPGTFLANGGLRSGMPLYCCGGLLFTVFCSNRLHRFFSFFFCLLWYTVIFIASTVIPNSVIPIREDFVETDLVITFVVVCITLTTVVGTAVEEYNTQRFSEINNGLIDSLGTLVEFRSIETSSHIHNVKEFTRIMLQTANETMPGVHFSRDEIVMISSAAVLHDIGKIAVPDVILNKPGKLSPAEFETMKKHALDGSHMVETFKEYQNPKYNEYCYEICRHHHEKYDGSGYPDGLKGEEIPLYTQIVSMADVYDALTSRRVYKNALSTDKAGEIILNESPGAFSERVLECFLAAKPELDRIVMGE